VVHERFDADCRRAGDALVVTPAGPVQAVPTATTIPLSNPGDPPGNVLPVPPEPFGTPTAREAGVHLHWAMPDGLTRGDAGPARSGLVPAGNPLALPTLPDRWVVVRLVHGGASLRAWVLEADRGEHHDIATWTEPGPAPAGATTGATGRRIIPREHLTAVAGGDPTWSATYDAVVDRFAFHDDLADLARGTSSEGPLPTLSYLVAGWWSDPALDPLHDCTSVGAYQNRARWLGWLAPEPEGLADHIVVGDALRAQRGTLTLASPPNTGTGLLARVLRDGDGHGEVTFTASGLLGDEAPLTLAAAPAMPRLTLLHGTATGVTLGGVEDLAPAAGAIELASGATGFGALSALLAEAAPDTHVSSERVLAAFGSGLLATIDAPGGLAAVDEDRHTSGFVAFGGGVRDRPDRVAEGDLLAGNRPTPSTVVRTQPDSGAKQAFANELSVARDANPIAIDTRQPTATAVGIVPPPPTNATLEHRDRYDVRAAFAGKRIDLTTVPERLRARTFRDVAVPLPRSFVPADLAFVLRGAARSLRHGDDGRFTPDGRLACRLPSQIVRGYQGVLEAMELPSGLRSLGSGAVPPEIDLLLREAVLTDPYRWPELVAWAVAARALAAPAVTTRVKAELALRSVHAQTRGRVPELDAGVSDMLRRASLAEGDDVSPVGLTRWAQPWIPLWCDWELQLRVDDALDRWVLGPIDLEVAPKSAADAPGDARVVRGRALLATATTRQLAAQIRQWLADEDARRAANGGQIDDAQRADLAAAATAADGVDVLTGSFGGVREALLGLDPLDAARTRILADGTPHPAPDNLPLSRALPLLIAGGAARLTRLRVVDAFGRWRDLSDATLAAAAIATTNAHSDGAPNVLLPPRLQRPSRIAFRFVDPRTADGASEVEAYVDQQHPEDAVSPIAGWLLPDHVDEALECFDASGTPLGQLLHDDITGAVVWEGAPGRPGPIGRPPDPGSDPGARHVTRFAAGCIAADVAARTNPAGPPDESALSALLRAIDTTLWTVDPLGSLGTGAVAGLVGRPIAVVRTTIRFDVVDDVALLRYADDAARAARVAAYAALAARAITVRLGELTRTDDTLLAYAVDDDYRQLRLVAPEVHTRGRVSGRLQGQLGTFGRGSQDPPAIEPITHPYVSGPTDLALRTAQTVRLTLFMAPGGKVHATCGLLQRKSLALARDWFHDALARLSPSFRIGPVLVDPTAVRLPMITGLGDRQTFTRRETPLTWRDDPIVAATQTAFLPEPPAGLQEGWIRVVQRDAPNQSA
jgi:hypothetical protein